MHQHTTNNQHTKRKFLIVIVNSLSWSPSSKKSSFSKLYLHFIFPPSIFLSFVFVFSFIFPPPIFLSFVFSSTLSSFHLLQSSPCLCPDPLFPPLCQIQVISNQKPEHPLITPILHTTNPSLCSYFVSCILNSVFAFLFVLSKSEPPSSPPLCSPTKPIPTK